MALVRAAELCQEWVDPLSLQGLDEALGLDQAVVAEVAPRIGVGIARGVLDEKTSNWSEQAVRAALGRPMSMTTTREEGRRRSHARANAGRGSGKTE